MKKLLTLLTLALVAQASYALNDNSGYTYHYHDSQTYQEAQDINDNTKKLLKNFQNFATFFGIDTTKPFGDDNKYPASFDIDNIKQINNLLLSGFAFINPLLGDVYKDFSSPGSSGITANAQIDQRLSNGNFAKTPTAQMVLNNLLTPSPADPCKDSSCINTEKMLMGLFGNELLSQSPDAATPRTSLTEQGLRELDADSFLSPIQYQDSQLDLATKYLRFSTGQLSPMTLPETDKFRQILLTAIDDKDETKRREARNQILNVAANMRTFSSQMSLGMSNLYHILSKRMPNTETDDKKSAARMEFEMATRRLLSTADNGGNTWQEQIEKAEPIVLFRQMLYLMAEQNYQLYLTRLENERILAAVSMTVIQSSQLTKQLGDTGAADISLDYDID